MKSRFSYTVSDSLKNIILLLQIQSLLADIFTFIGKLDYNKAIDLQEQAASVAISLKK